MVTPMHIRNKAQSKTKLSLEMQGPVNVKAKEACLSKEVMKRQAQNSVCRKSAATGNHRRTSRGFNHFKTSVVPGRGNTHN